MEMSKLTVYGPPYPAVKHDSLSEMQAKNRLQVIFLIILSQLLAACSLEGKVTMSKPLIWNVSNLDTLKTCSNCKLYYQIIQVSDSFCKQLPVTVMDKKKTFAPSYHYYCSMGPYYWPDSSNIEGKYILKDGLVNPERNQYDAINLIKLSDRCKYLSVAFYLTNNQKYYDAFIKQIKAWFVDEQTYMFPSLEYAQVIPGYKSNKGTATGLIDTYTFNDVIESIRLVNSVKQIDKDIKQKLYYWFGAISEWMDNSSFGKIIKKANNNIGLAYDVTLTNFFIFSGKRTRALEIVNNFVSDRINSQINEKGQQLEELRRSKALSYSMYNLTHIVDFLFIATFFRKDLFTASHEKIENAINYLQQYVEDKQSFPYQQITNWNGKGLEMQKKRLMRFNTGVSPYNRYEILSSKRIDDLLQ